MSKHCPYCSEFPSNCYCDPEGEEVAADIHAEKSAMTTRQRAELEEASGEMSN